MELDLSKFKEINHSGGTEFINIRKLSRNVIDIIKFI
jgi:hypothetical protein